MATDIFLRGTALNKDLKVAITFTLNPNKPAALRLRHINVGQLGAASHNGERYALELNLLPPPPSPGLL